MRKILLMIPCMVLALLVLFPVKAEAANSVEYGGKEYASITKFSHYFGEDKKDWSLNDYTICAEKSDSTILVFAAESFYGTILKVDYYYSPIYVVSIGGDNCIDVYQNGELILENKILEELSLPSDQLELLNTSLASAAVSQKYHVYSIYGGGQYDPLFNPEPYFCGINGYFIYKEYSEVDGNPSLLTLKYAVENIETLKYQEEVYDSSLPVPVLKISNEEIKYLDNIYGDYDYFVFAENYNSDYKIEYKIKLYGPSVLYIKNGGFGGEEWVIKEEVFSDYIISSTLYSSNIVRFGTTYNSGTFDYSDNYVDLLGLSQSFTKNLSSSVEFEFDDVWTSLNCNKDSYRKRLAFANIEFYDFEIYARFVDDSGIDKKNGSWGHIVVERGGTVKRSEGGYENSPDSDDDNRNDDDLIVDIPDVPLEINGSNIWETIENLVSGMGNVPNIVSQIFGFFPDWLLYIIASGIAAIVILRFLGR